MIDQDALQGHWQRDWIRAPGFEDQTTAVHWMQCGRTYVDLRIPSSLPDVSGAGCLAALGAPALLALMAGEGFAGTIRVDQDVCTWDRKINWHGRTARVDAGAMSFDAGGALIEDGVHADYRERWHAQRDAPVEAFAVAGHGHTGFLVGSEARFLLGLGRPGADGSAALMDALGQGAVPDELDLHFASVYLMGRWEGAHGTIGMATDPFMVGRAAVRRDGARLTLQRQRFRGQLERWDMTLRCLLQPVPQSVR